MSEFLASYGLWLLLALIVVIALFLIFSKKDEAPGADSFAEQATKPVEPHASVPSTHAAPPPPAPVPAEPVALASPPPAKVKTPAAEPIPAPAAAPAASTPAGKAAADNLLLLKGVGPKLNTLLGEIGVTSFAQIAAWTDADIAAVDARLGNFKGRPVRDHWVDQAKYLAAGDTAGFEAKYGKL
ncbi:MAG: hypothetical protein DI547_15840 [Sphingobium sp.]|nr:MAG: hypothetical protein DI547_15840 [Sphingobium sp.]